MAERVQKQRADVGDRVREPEPVEAKSDRSSVELTDEILDEIDELLESNAEAFVRAYVQKGGE